MAPFTCTLLTLFFISCALQEGKNLRLLVSCPGAHHGSGVQTLCEGSKGEGVF